MLLWNPDRPTKLCASFLVSFTLEGIFLYTSHHRTYVPWSWSPWILFGFIPHLPMYISVTNMSKVVATSCLLGSISIMPWIYWTGQYLCLSRVIMPTTAAAVQSLHKFWWSVAILYDPSVSCAEELKRDVGTTIPASFKSSMVALVLQGWSIMFGSICSLVEATPTSYICTFQP